MWTDPEKWTCPYPTCGRTITVIGSDEDYRCCLTAVQTMHGNTHRQTDTARTRRLVRALKQDDRKRRAS